MQDNNQFQQNNSPQSNPLANQDSSYLDQIDTQQSNLAPQQKDSTTGSVTIPVTSGAVSGGLTLQPSPTFNQSLNSASDSVNTSAQSTPPFNNPSPFETPTPQVAAVPATSFTPDVAPVDTSIVQSKIVGNKSKKKLIVLSAILIPLVLVSGSFGYYYFVMRTPNSTYAEATDQVNTMLASTKSITSNSTKLPLLGDSSSSGTDTTKLADQSLASINSYNSALKKLKTLDVVKNDKDIEKALSTNSSKFEKYGTEYPDLIKTSSTIVSLTKQCGASLTQIAGAKTIAEFDTIASICTNYMQQNPTIPTQALAAQYSGILALIKQALDTSKNALQLALSGKLVDAQKAKAAATAITNQLQQIQAGLAQNKLTAPADPSKELESLKRTVTDRENMFFR